MVQRCRGKPVAAEASRKAAEHGKLRFFGRFRILEYVRNGFSRRADAVDILRAGEERLQLRHGGQGELVGCHVAVWQGRQPVSSAELVARFDEVR